jgi:hypothetical protein
MQTSYLRDAEEANADARKNGNTAMEQWFVGMQLLQLQASKVYMSWHHLACS